MPGVPLKHSTHPPLTLPLDALLSLFSLPPSPPPPCRRQPSSDRRIPPRPDYSTNDQFIFVSFTIRIRCSFSLLSSSATKRLVWCLHRPSRPRYSYRTCALRARHDDGSGHQHKVPFPPHHFYQTSTLYRFLLQVRGIGFPHFWYLNPRAGASKLGCKRSAPLFWHHVLLPKSTAWRVRMASFVAPCIFPNLI